MSFYIFILQSWEWPERCRCGSPGFTGWSGHSDVWVCRAARRGLAGKTPPTGSSQWTVCDHHPDCRRPPLPHPSTVEDTFIHIHADQRTRWLTAHEARNMNENIIQPKEIQPYSQVKFESVWSFECGTETVQMSLGCFGCPSEEILWKQKENIELL